MRNNFLNDYFVAIYDLDDNYIIGFDDIKDLPKFFNKPLKYVLWYIRENYCLKKDGIKYKVYLYEKELEKEEVRRR